MERAERETISSADGGAAVAPDDLLASLRKNKKALATFDDFSPSQRREYIARQEIVRAFAERGENVGEHPPRGTREAGDSFRLQEALELYRQTAREAAGEGYEEEVIAL